MSKKKNKNQDEAQVLEKNQNLNTSISSITNGGLSMELSAEEIQRMMGQGMFVEAVDESPVWIVKFQHFPIMNVLSVKFTALTTGEPSTGQVVMEIECRPGINKLLNDWVKNPSYKEAIIEISSQEGDILDVISMKCRPIAMAIGSLGDLEDAGKPWMTTIQLSTQDIDYMPSVN